MLTCIRLKSRVNYITVLPIALNKISPKYILSTDCSDYIKKKYKGTRVIYNVISIIFALHILV